MTINDLLKRVSEEDYDKTILFTDGVGWSNIDVKITDNDILVSRSSNALFSDDQNG